MEMCSPSKNAILLRGRERSTVSTTIKREEEIIQISKKSE